MASSCTLTFQAERQYSEYYLQDMDDEWTGDDPCVCWDEIHALFDIPEDTLEVTLQIDKFRRWEGVPEGCAEDDYLFYLDLNYAFYPQAIRLGFDPLDENEGFVNHELDDNLGKYLKTICRINSGIFWVRLFYEVEE